MLAPEKPERAAAHMRAFASASQDEPPCRTPAALVSTPSGNGDGGRMMLGSGRGPERRTTPARLSPDVVGQPARHRRDSWGESRPVRLPDGRASHGSTGVARAADSLGLRGPGGVPNPRGTSGIQRDRARPHQIEVLDLQVFRGRSPPNRGSLKIVVSPVRVRVSPSRRACKAAVLQKGLAGRRISPATLVGLFGPFQPLGQACAGAATFSAMPRKQQFAAPGSTARGPMDSRGAVRTRHCSALCQGRSKYGPVAPVGVLDTLSPRRQQLRVLAAAQTGALGVAQTGAQHLQAGLGRRR